MSEDKQPVSNSVPPEAQTQGAGSQAQGGRQSLPPPSFHMLISAMAGQCLIHLGVAPDPGSGKTSINLEEAKYTIDLLQILKEKTQGNLTPEEQRLLDTALYDLRMRYVTLLR